MRVLNTAMLALAMLMLRCAPVAGQTKAPETGAGDDKKDTNYYRCARVSGDPHYFMFLGCRHDCQSTGTHIEWTDDQNWQILGHHRRCNPNARRAVMCVRQVAARIRNPYSKEWAYVKWGRFGRQGAFPSLKNPWTGKDEPAEEPRAAVTDKILMCPSNVFSVEKGIPEDYGGELVTDVSGQTCWSFSHRDIANVKFTAWDGKYYRVQYKKADGLLYVADKWGLVEFGWRGYLITGCIRQDVVGHGLMGYNDPKATEKQCFLNPFGYTNIHPNTVAKKRYNGVKTQHWCTEVYRLALDHPDNVIGTPAAVHAHTLSDANMTANNDIEEAELEEVGKPLFTTAEENQEAIEICEQITSGNPEAMEDCVFDVRLMEDKSQAREVGLSNVEAANSIDAKAAPQSASDGAVAGIVTGSVVGAVAVAAIGVLYVRLKRSKQELATVAGATAGNGEIMTNDNL